MIKLMNTSYSKRMPRAALIPGILGLIPFYILAVSTYATLGLPPVIALLGMVTYGAVILSFVGAIWWGVAINAPEGTPRTGLFLWSVIPALIGWFATLTAPDLGVLMLTIGFLIQWVFDAFLSKKHPALFPPWVFMLRSILTAGVLSALYLAWWLLV
jgi:hypothetical protein